MNFQNFEYVGRQIHQDILLVKVVIRSSRNRNGLKCKNNWPRLHINHQIEIEKLLLH